MAMRNNIDDSDQKCNIWWQIRQSCLLSNIFLSKSVPCNTMNITKKVRV